MEQEIDLRPYGRALLRFWWLIALTGLVFGTLAYVVAALQTPEYQATALVAVLEPDQSVAFDPRFLAVETKATLYRSFPDLSKSDEVLSALLGAVESMDIHSLADLRGRLTAESGSDLTLLYLRARHEEASAAAQIVNQWAATFVKTANEIYAGRSSSQLEYYSAQVAEGRARLDAAEQALVDFQSRNLLLPVTNELDSLTNLQAEYVKYADSLTALQDDVRALRVQESALPGGVAGVTGEFTALALQARAIHLEELLPFSLQVDATGDSAIATQNQGQFLDSLDRMATEMLPIIAARLAEMEPRILELQGRKEDLSATTLRLTTDRDLALETYMTLVRKLDEERLTTGDDSVGFRQVSHAAVPEAPVDSDKILALAAGTAFGVLLSALVVVLLAWRRS